MSHKEPFDAATWDQLPAFLEKLPEPVHMVVWGDATASQGEKDAVLLCQTLANRFTALHFSLRPRRENYPFYPVIGFMGQAEGEEVDFGLRIIGLPAGYQITSLITAVQAVSFRGMTLEPATRIKLSRLPAEVRIEIITSAEDEGGPVVAKTAFGLAVAHPRVRAYLIMADAFPEAVIRYSVNYVPHTVINNRVHVEGVVNEEALLKHVAAAVKRET
jgi:alkyl hydroperoxide reductase subunit AhpF